LASGTFLATQERKESSAGLETQEAARDIPVQGREAHAIVAHTPAVLDVVNHYDEFFRLGLTEQEKGDLIQLMLGL